MKKISICFLWRSQDIRHPLMKKLREIAERKAAGPIFHAVPEGSPAFEHRGTLISYPKEASPESYVTRGVLNTQDLLILHRPAFPFVSAATWQTAIESFQRDNKPRVSVAPFGRHLHPAHLWLGIETLIRKTEAVAGIPVVQGAHVLSLPIPDAASAKLHLLWIKALNASGEILADSGVYRVSRSASTSLDVTRGPERESTPSLALDLTIGLDKNQLKVTFEPVPDAVSYELIWGRENPDQYDALLPFGLDGLWTYSRKQKARADIKTGAVITGRQFLPKIYRKVDAFRVGDVASMAAGSFTPYALSEEEGAQVDESFLFEDMLPGRR